ncbi:MAG TPA: hypothetical protein VGF55_07595, partial [Gemmataceae bacterium]
GPRRNLAGAGWFARFRPDGRQYATLPPPGVANTVAELWDADTGRPTGSLPGPEPTIFLTFSRDGNRVVGYLSSLAAPQIETLLAWDRAADGRWADPVTVGGTHGAGYFRAFLADGRTVVTADQDHVLAWNPPAPPRPLTMDRPGPTSLAVAAALSPDGTSLAVGWLTAEEENRHWPSVVVYDTATWRRRFAAELLDRPTVPPAKGGAYRVSLAGMEFAPDGRTLAVVGEGNWGLIQPAGQLVRTFVCVLDAATGALRSRLVDHYGPAFTADGRSLLSVRQTLTADELTMTDLDTGRGHIVAAYPRQVGPWSAVTPAYGRYAYRRAWLAWPTRVADGRILAVRTADPPEDAVSDRLAEWSVRYLHRPINPHLDARLIDAATGRELAAMWTAFSMCDRATIAPDGRTLVVPGGPPTTPGSEGDEAGTIWDLPPRQPVAWLAAAAGGWMAVVLGLAVVVRRRVRARAG